MHSFFASFLVSSHSHEHVSSCHYAGLYPHFETVCAKNPDLETVGVFGDFLFAVLNLPQPTGDATQLEEGLESRHRLAEKGPYRR